MRRTQLVTALVALVALVALALASCGGGSGSSDAGVDTFAGRKREVLANLGENVMLPAYRDFATAAAALETATASLRADPSEANRAAAQQAWRDAATAWQAAEMFQLGPAGASGDMGVVGGQDLRGEIYSFPLTNTCRIDQETLESAHEDPDALAGELVNVRGLDALEYLLFVEGTENTCLPGSPINMDGSWAALDAEAVLARRARYAHTAATLVKRHADALVGAWEPSGGNFVGQFATAGDGSGLFSTARRAFDDVAGAMLYVDTMIKDMKIGEPAGFVRCTTETCPEELESRWARVGKEAILVNLRTFQRLFLGAEPGTDAPGFDDLLNEMGAAALSARLRDSIAASITAVEAVPGGIEDAISTDRAALQAAFDALTELSRLFKMDLVTILDIELPSNFGDND
jgi:predicted lipoprotein